MGLSAPMGYIPILNPGYTEYRSYDSGRTEIETVQPQHYMNWQTTHLRAGLSNSPVITVKGLPWRQPTSYERRIHKYKLNPGTKSGRVQVDFAPDKSYNWTQRGFRTIFNDLDQVNAPFFSPYGVWDSDEHRKVITECLVKLGEDKPQLGQFAAESKQAAEMLTDTSIGLLELLKAVKHGQFSRIPLDFKTLKDTAGNALLQWNYGWKPLCSDLYDMHKDLTTKAPKGMMLSASRSVITKRDLDFKWDGLECHVKGQIRNSCKLWAGFSDQLMHDATSYGLMNPLSLGWELVPYSFVVDWFLPIGNVLQALSATAGLEFIGGYHSSVQEGKIQVHDSLGDWEREFFYFHRAAYDQFPKPQIYAERQPFKPMRLANLTALVSQLFK